MSARTFNFPRGYCFSHGVARWLCSDRPVVRDDEVSSNVIFDYFPRYSVTDVQIVNFHDAAAARSKLTSIPSSCGCCARCLPRRLNASRRHLCWPTIARRRFYLQQYEYTKLRRIRFELILLPCRALDDKYPLNFLSVGQTESTSVKLRMAKISQKCHPLVGSD